MAKLPPTANGAVFAATGAMGFRGRIGEWWGLRHGYVSRGGYISGPDEFNVMGGWRRFYDRHKAAIWRELSTIDEIINPALDRRQT